MRHSLLLLLAASALRALDGEGKARGATVASPTSLYTSGTVYLLGPAQADGRQVLVGSFTRAGGQPVGNVLRLLADGSPDLAFTQQLGAVAYVGQVAAGLGGQYVLAASSPGNPITAGGLTRPALLRLNADGTADASFNAGAGPTGTRGGTVYASHTDAHLVQPDGKVVAGGDFDTFSGTPAPGLVRLLPGGAVDAAFVANLGTGFDEPPYVLQRQPDGKLLVGGGFTAFDGHPAPGLVRLNADGTYDNTFAARAPFVGAYDYLLLQPDGKLLVTDYTSAYVPTVLRLLPSGALDPSFSVDPALGPIYAADGYGYDGPLALQADGKLVVLGDFTSSSGQPTKVARLNADGSRDATFQLAVPTDGPITGVQVLAGGNVLLVSANTGTSFGTLDAAVGAYNSTGAWQAGYAPRLQQPGNVTALARLADNSLLVGGDFTEWSGQPARRVAHLSSTGAYDAAFGLAVGPGLQTVNALAAQPDGRVLVGGQQGVRRLLASGAPDASFTPFAQPITALAVQPDGKVLAGGRFLLSSGGTTHRGLVRLGSTGALDPSFVRGAFSSNFSTTSADALLLQPDGKVLAGSAYSSLSDPGYSFVVRYESTGSVDNTFTPQAFLGLTYALAVQPDGKVLVGGQFGRVGRSPGTAQTGLARLGADGKTDTGFAPAFSPGSSPYTTTVRSLALQPNGRVLAGGRFATAGSPAYTNLTRVLADAQPDASFGAAASATNGLVSALLVQPDGAILVGGNFTLLGGKPAHKLVRLNAPNVLAVAAPAAAGVARPALWPVPARELLHVRPDAAAQPLAAELLDALGRVVLTRPLNSPAEFTLDTHALPAGLYVLRLRYAAGAVSQPLSVQ